MVVMQSLHTLLGSAVDTWATVAVAIGTIGAVTYALFRDLVVTPRRRPKLDLRFDHSGNDQSSSGKRRDSMQRLSACELRTERERTRPMTSS
jgi:hypothetical protein